MKTVMFLNGPNANLYGLDPKGSYGNDSFPQIESACMACAEDLELELIFRQSNHEGVLIDWIQEARTSCDGILINAAGLTYTSIAILDALLAFDGPIIECHMSNIWKREAFRSQSFISKTATGVIAGLGVQGYLLGLTAMNTLIKDTQA
ncbi:type II 3-dehydroquinate dehydratase [Pacificibacter marinus]|uniref:3-dehydroquinate dehydratase n=1 Tax=Pacificibacter marinus TaxID=658057 RepID=A0A1Y5RYH4_9RHOB|nr:type II 3-dehydroquinate dehydratase [Pacificibacter marinus]SEK39343.1 3-dehydroquinate dehydratase [Pacificibacter marinus]SLN25487.1 3-dehydroquinate dehydratase [Pacificibacter marinus]